MLFPRAVEAPAELSAAAIDGPAGVFAAAGADEDDRERRGAAAEAADGPPRLVT